MVHKVCVKVIDLLVSHRSQQLRVDALPSTNYESRGRNKPQDERSTDIPSYILQASSVVHYLSQVGVAVDEDVEPTWKWLLNKLFARYQSAFSFLSCEYFPHWVLPIRRTGAEISVTNTNGIHERTNRSCFFFVFFYTRTLYVHQTRGR